MRAVLSVVFAFSVVASSAIGDTHDSRHHTYQVEVLVEGLEHPWGLAILPGGDLLVTERPGRLRLVRDGALVPDPVPGAPSVHAEGQGGLLDVVLHPEFADNHFVYFTYARRCESGGNTTAMGRGVWNGDAVEGFTELYAADACAPRGRHHGSRLAFDADGYLYMSVGDRGQDERGQDPTDNADVVMRLHDDGSIPDDNPFVGSDAGHDANWTWGNRNPQGMAVNPVTGEVWAVEHGPRGGDEVNVLRRGRNYGWATISIGTQYSGVIISETTHEEAGMEPPVKQWTPSIAPSGMAFYSGAAFPAWEGDLLVGALSHQHLARVRFDGHYEVESERLLDRTHGRIRDVRVDPEGFVYLLTDAEDGRVLRLVPAD